ncbi:AraC family transcriptional regulator [Pseudomonas fluorescens]|nr:AraC family transcriptional regulator [Pseudomonas fluorescens]
MAGHAFKVRRIAGLGVEIVEADSDRTFVRHMHEHFGIGLVLRGAQRSASGRGPVQAIAGELISVNPAEVHDGAPIGEGTRRWQMLYFDPLLITQAFKDMTDDGGICAHEFAYPVLKSRRAAELFRTLYRTIAQAEEFGDQMKIDETLSLLLEHLLDQPVPISPTPGIAANRAKTMIDDDPQSPMSLALLAKEADLSRFQLVRAFTRLTGLPPHAYLLQRRIQRARQLIAAGMSLADASLASGFADQSHMTRCFVRSFGFSPGMYARQSH